MCFFIKTKTFHRLCRAVIAGTFFLTLLQPVGFVHAQTLPAPGEFIGMSEAFVPVLIKGMTIHSDNPLRFDFIVDSGQSGLSQEAIQPESERLIRYFLASLTIPKGDLWVNLSPHEKDRIIPDDLIQTELGQELLAQDYLLKQLTASLMYPEGETGRAFWERIYSKAFEQYGTTDIPLDTLNKVWIVPDKAVVFEKNNTVVVTESRFKVMTEEDYLALSSSLIAHGQQEHRNTGAQELTPITSIIREILIPEIEKEVNEGKNFAPLRQIYHSLILAQWYKDTLKESLLTQVYADQSRLAGIDLADKDAKDTIYDRYLAAYKKGIFDYIKEEYDPATQSVVPRKYFSGGIPLAEINVDVAQLNSKKVEDFTGSGFRSTVDLAVLSDDKDEVILNGKPVEMFTDPDMTKLLDKLVSPHAVPQRVVVVPTTIQERDELTEYGLTEEDYDKKEVAKKLFEQFKGKNIESVQADEENGFILRLRESNNFLGNELTELHIYWTFGDINSWNPNKRAAFMNPAIMEERFNEFNDWLRSVLNHFVVIGVFPFVVPSDEKREVLLKALFGQEADISKYKDLVVTDDEYARHEREVREKKVKENSFFLPTSWKEKEDSQGHNDEGLSKLVKIFKPAGDVNYIVPEFIYQACLEVFGKEEIPRDADLGSRRAQKLKSHLYALKEEGVTEAETYLMTLFPEKATNKFILQRDSFLGEWTRFAYYSEKNILPYSEKTPRYLSKMAWYTVVFRRIHTTKDRILYNEVFNRLKQNNILVNNLLMLESWEYLKYQSLFGWATFLQVQSGGPRVVHMFNQLFKGLREARDKLSIDEQNQLYKLLEKNISKEFTDKDKQQFEKIMGKLKGAEQGDAQFAVFFWHLIGPAFDDVVRVFDKIQKQFSLHYPDQYGPGKENFVKLDAYLKNTEKMIREWRDGDQAMTADPNAPLEGIENFNGDVTQLLDRLLLPGANKQRLVIIPETVQERDELMRFGLTEKIEDKDGATHKVVEQYQEHNVIDARLVNNKELILEFNESVHFFNKELRELHLYMEGGVASLSKNQRDLLLKPKSFDGSDRSARDSLKNTLERFDMIGLFPFVIQKKDDKEVLFIELFGKGKYADQERSLIGSEEEYQWLVEDAQRQKLNAHNTAPTPVIMKLKEKRNGRAPSQEELAEKALKEIFTQVSDHGYLIPRYLTRIPRRVYVLTDEERKRGFGLARSSKMKAYLESQANDSAQAREWLGVLFPEGENAKIFDQARNSLFDLWENQANFVPKEDVISSGEALRELTLMAWHESMIQLKDHKNFKRELALLKYFYEFFNKKFERISVLLKQYAPREDHEEFVYIWAMLLYIQQMDKNDSDQLNDFLRKVDEGRNLRFDRNLWGFKSQTKIRFRLDTSVSILNVKTLLNLEKLRNEQEYLYGVAYYLQQILLPRMVETLKALKGIQRKLESLYPDQYGPGKENFVKLDGYLKNTEKMIQVWRDGGGPDQAMTADPNAPLEGIENFNGDVTQLLDRLSKEGDKKLRLRIVPRTIKEREALKEYDELVEQIPENKSGELLRLFKSLRNQIDHIDVNFNSIAIRFKTSIQLFGFNLKELHLFSEEKMISNSQRAVLSKTSALTQSEGDKLKDIFQNFEVIGVFPFVLSNKSDKEKFVATLTSDDALRKKYGDLIMSEEEYEDQTKAAEKSMPMVDNQDENKLTIDGLFIPLAENSYLVPEELYFFIAKALKMPLKGDPKNTYEKFKMFFKMKGKNGNTAEKYSRVLFPKDEDSTGESEGKLRKILNSQRPKNFYTIEEVLKIEGGAHWAAVNMAWNEVVFRMEEMDKGFLKYAYEMLRMKHNDVFHVLNKYYRTKKHGMFYAWSSLMQAQIMKPEELLILNRFFSEIDSLKQKFSQAELNKFKTLLSESFNNFLESKLTLPEMTRKFYDTYKDSFEDMMMVVVVDMLCNQLMPQAFSNFKEINDNILSLSKSEAYKKSSKLDSKGYEFFYSTYSLQWQNIAGLWMGKDIGYSSKMSEDKQEITIQWTGALPGLTQEDVSVLRGLLNDKGIPGLLDSKLAGEGRLKVRLGPFTYQLNQRSVDLLDNNDSFLMSTDNEDMKKMLLQMVSDILSKSFKTTSLEERLRKVFTVTFGLDTVAFEDFSIQRDSGTITSKSGKDILNDQSARVFDYVGLSFAVAESIADFFHPIFNLPAKDQVVHKLQSKSLLDSAMLNVDKNTRTMMPLGVSEKVGGIDMNAIHVERNGAGPAVSYDPAILSDLLKDGVKGFTPVIIETIPIQSIYPLLGLESPDLQTPRLSRVNY